MSRQSSAHRIKEAIRVLTASTSFRRLTDLEVIPLGQAHVLVELIDLRAGGVFVSACACVRARVGVCPRSMRACVSTHTSQELSPVRRGGAGIWFVDVLPT
jgi:hypothetical protein